MNEMKNEIVLTEDDIILDAEPSNTLHSECVPQEQTEASQLNIIDSALIISPVTAHASETGMTHGLDTESSSHVSNSKSSQPLSSESNSSVKEDSHLNAEMFDSNSNSDNSLTENPTTDISNTEATDTEIAIKVTSMENGLRKSNEDNQDCGIENNIPPKGFNQKDPTENAIQQENHKIQPIEANVGHANEKELKGIAAKGNNESTDIIEISTPLPNFAAQSISIAQENESSVNNTILNEQNEKNKTMNVESSIEANDTLKNENSAKGIATTAEKPVESAEYLFNNNLTHKENKIEHANIEENQTPFIKHEEPYMDKMEQASTPQNISSTCNENPISTPIKEKDMKSFIEADEGLQQLNHQLLDKISSQPNLPSLNNENTVDVDALEEEKFRREMEMEVIKEQMALKELELSKIKIHRDELIRVSEVETIWETGSSGSDISTSTPFMTDELPLIGESQNSKSIPNSVAPTSNADTLINLATHDPLTPSPQRSKRTQSTLAQVEKLPNKGGKTSTTKLYSEYSEVLKGHPQSTIDGELNTQKKGRKGCCSIM